MKKFYLLIFLFVFINTGLRAQYANQGNGTLRNYIWWFDWANATIGNGFSRTFTTTDGLVVTIRFSNVSGDGVVPDVMNTWYGAVLHSLYNFTDVAIKPSLHSQASSTPMRFDMEITAQRNGVPVAFTFIAADAEASVDAERTLLTTTGGNWKTIELFKNSTQNTNPVSGCNTQSIVIADTYGGTVQLGQNPIMATTSNGMAPLRVSATMDRTVVVGGMAIAFGLLAPFDGGDLQPAFGVPQHALTFTNVNECAYPTPAPALMLQSGLYLGNATPDADILLHQDDNLVGADEDAVTVWPEYNGNDGTYSLDVPVTNLTGNPAYIKAWFDYNNDGVFSPSEGIAQNVAAVNPGSIRFTWTNLPATLPAGATPNFAFRFRVSSNQAAVQDPGGYAPDGEVEDYYRPIVQACLNMKVSAGPDQRICTGQTAQLNASGAQSYIWNTDLDLSDPGISDPVATPSTTKEFYVLATHANGCTSKDTVVVAVDPLPQLEAPVVPPVCKGTNIELTTTGADQTVWTDINGMTIGTGNQFSFTPLYSTLIRATLSESRCNTQQTVDVPVTVIDPPITYVTKSNDLDCRTGRAVLLASGGTEYQWMDAQGSILHSGRAMTVSPAQTTKYYVYVLDNYGCGSMDSITVNMVKTGASAHYEMPTAFTPNGDGRNDCFGVKLPGLVGKVEFTIYDRWGNVVFHTNKVTDCWDGTYKGVPCDVATFVYVLRIESECGNVDRKGTVTLLR